MSRRDNRGARRSTSMAVGAICCVGGLLPRVDGVLLSAAVVAAEDGAVFLFVDVREHFFYELLAHGICELPPSRLGWRSIRTRRRLFFRLCLCRRFLDIRR